MQQDCNKTSSCDSNIGEDMQWHYVMYGSRNLDGIKDWDFVSMFHTDFIKKKEIRDMSESGVLGKRIWSIGHGYVLYMTLIGCAHRCHLCNKHGDPITIAPENAEKILDEYLTENNLIESWRHKIKEPVHHGRTHK